MGNRHTPLRFWNLSKMRMGRSSARDRETNATKQRQRRSGRSVVHCGPGAIELTEGTNSGAGKCAAANFGKSWRRRRCGSRATRSDSNGGRVLSSRQTWTVSGPSPCQSVRSQVPLFLDEPTDELEELYDELEDPAGAAAVMSRVSRSTAGWLARFILNRAEKERERAGEEIDQELRVPCHDKTFVKLTSI